MWNVTPFLATGRIKILFYSGPGASSLTSLCTTVQNHPRSPKSSSSLWSRRTAGTDWTEPATARRVEAKHRKQAKTMTLWSLRLSKNSLKVCTFRRHGLVCGYLLCVCHYLSYKAPCTCQIRACRLPEADWAVAEWPSVRNQPKPRHPPVDAKQSAWWLWGWRPCKGGSTAWICKYG